MGRLRFFRNPFPYPAPDVYDLQFTAAGVGTVGGARNADISACGLSFARNSAAWDDSLASYATGVPVITAARGFYCQEARTNSFLGSNAPATQTIALAAGSFVCWLTGSGSVAVTGGASGTATAAAPFVFTLAASASCTFTVSGTVTFCQVEAGAFPTLPIVTTSAAVARTLASCSTGRSAIASGTVAVKARSAKGVASGSTPQTAWAIDDGSAGNRIKIDRNSSRLLRLVQSTGGVDTSSTIGTLADDADVTLVLAFAAGDQIVKSTLGADLVKSQPLPAGALTLERLMNGAGSSAQWDGSIYRIARWRARLPDATLATILANF